RPARSSRMAGRICPQSPTARCHCPELAHRAKTEFGVLRPTLHHSGGPESLAPVKLARHAMATRFEVVLYGANPISLPAAGEEALDEIERLEAQLSLYRPSSEIARINARAAHEPVRVTPSVFALLEQARRLSEETQGAFDITVAPLVRCWGFMENR